ncbi:MAG: ATP-binding protein [Bacteroidota bacterium]|nr:ATP-binding protein [Bacteroidota bacterium]
MKDIVDFFMGLFATNKWPARWKCGEWTDFHGWMYIISDLMIWAAYFLMPVLILKYFSTKRSIIKFQKVYILFASFILLCGSTHFLDAMMFWIPMYRFNTLVRFITGVISLFTVYHLMKILPEAFKQKTNIELENEIIRREEAESKLADANRSLEAFAYIASHDLQEPLRKVIVYSKLLINSNKDNFDSKSAGYAQTVISSTERMQTMIKDVLTLSTINDTVNFTKVSLTIALKEALEDLEIKILDRNALINYQEMPTITGNLAYLRQMFMNLVSNAIKFSNDQPVINVYGEIKQHKVVVYVKDNGIGMDEKDTAKIFNPFERLHNRQKYEGAGIGLAICRKIAELHKGDIRVESKLAAGTTFIIEFPFEEGE